MKRANMMSTITDDLTIKVKNKFTSSNAEKTNENQWIHLTIDVTQFHTTSRGSYKEPPFFFGFCRSRSEFFFPFNAFKAFVRSFHKFILPEINCEKHAMLSIEEAAKESECGPLQVHIVVQVRKPHKIKTKQNQNTTHKNQPKRNTTKNQLDSNML